MTELTSQEIKFIKKTISNHFNFDDVTVILFGSYAKGTARQSSDIDLALKSDTPLNASKWQELESELEDSDFPKKVDVIDYQRVTQEFQKVIDEQGSPL